MEKVYHILLIDDEEDNINLIETELAKLDIQVQIDIIQKEEQLIGRLENNPPDVVISNYHMPTLTGISALQIVQDRHPQLPFIMVAGSLGEEKAINVILQGASDYAMKQNLDRLGPAILREHTNYEKHKKKSRQLEKTRTQYENLVQSVNGIVWEADAETFEFHYVSPQSKQLLGYSPEEWVGKSNFWQEHIHPEDRKEAVQFCHHKTQQGVNHEFEYRMIDANNEVVWLRDYVNVVTENGKPNRLCGFMVDISREKKAERQRDIAYDIADIGHWELDLKNEDLYWSKAIKKMHEVAPDYEPDLKSALEFYKEGDHRQIITTAVENAIETGESFEAELQIITSKGNEKWVRVLGETEFRNGNCVHIFGSTQDITKRKEAEHKLQESIDRYESVSKATSDTIWDLNLVTDTIVYSQNIYNVFGYERQQVDEIEDWWRNKIHPDDRPEVLGTIEKALHSSSGRFQMEYRFQAADGTYKYIYDRAFVVKDQEGNSTRIIGAMRDVSDQKEAEQKMKEAFQGRERILDRINEAFFATDQNWNVTYWNKQAEEVIGVTRDDILGEHFWETFPVAKEHKFFKEYKRALREQVSVRFEEYYPPLKKWFEVTAYPSEEGLSVFFRDITERREAEQSLRELYEKNRLVLESTDEGIYGIDTEGRCTFINKAAANKLGYRSEECLGKNMHKLIHHKYSNGELYPESECPIFISINKHESCRVMDEVFWRADGTRFEVEYTSNPMIEDGEIMGGVVAFSDITVRKKQEQELRESLEEKETLLMEIHHRVKNNLAVVSSMMQLQAYKEEDENVQKKLEDAINRIKTMGGIHELLYQSKSFSRVDADKNIRKLITDIVETFQISVELDVEFDLQKISLNINQAIPFSLIVNEVITNVMKHAFAGRNQGALSVSLAEENHIISIHVMDNGKGLPDNFKHISNGNTLGLQLINTLCTQLKGEYTYDSLDEGTLFTLTFGKADIKGSGNAYLN